MTTIIGFGWNFFHNLGSDPLLLYAPDSSLPMQEKGICEEKPYLLSLLPPSSSASEDKEKKSSDDITQISAGPTHSTVVASSGDLYFTGTLQGKVATVPSSVKTHVPVKCLAISSGRRHVLALMEGGVVMSWGGGHFGQLGHGNSVLNLKKPKVIERLLPQYIGGQVASVYAGPYHSACITTNGRAFSWGINRKSQCGVEGGPRNTVSCPLPVVCSAALAKLALARSQTLGLSVDGTVYSWGGGSKGDDQPTALKALERVIIKSIAAGDRHFLALSNGGRPFSWGYNADGQLGHGHMIHLLSPRLIADLEFSKEKNGLPVKIVEVYAAGNSSAVLTNTGDVYTWGYGDQGQLGTMVDTSFLTFMEPGPASKTGPGNRIRECRVFDSKYNVLLPKRVEATRKLGLCVKNVSLAPSCLILTCTEREANQNDMPPRTLFEQSEEKRTKGLDRLRIMGSNRVLEGSETAVVEKNENSKKETISKIDNSITPPSDSTAAAAPPPSTVEDEKAVQGPRDSKPVKCTSFKWKRSKGQESSQSSSSLRMNVARKVLSAFGKKG